MIFLSEETRQEAENEPAIWISDSDAPDVEQALALIREKAPKCVKASAYYEGAHRLSFASDQYRNIFGHLFHTLSDNLLSVVVEILSDRMVVTGFQAETGPAAAGEVAWSIWKKNRMDAHGVEVTRDAFITGDAYVLIWPDDAGMVRIYPQASVNTCVLHDPEAPEKILWAAKVWPTYDRKLRLNLYYPDRIEKWISGQSFQSGGYTMPEKASAFIPYEAEGPFPMPNPYGVVPIFHFPNNARIGQFGRSEILPLVPLQNALNKSIVDLLVNMEYQAFPQRYATGIEIRRDPDTGRQVHPFTPGKDRVWIAAAPDARFGNLQQADLTPFLEVSESFRREIARISGIPLHYLLQTGSFPSGEALRISETRLIKKVENRQICFGNVWEDAMKFALVVAGAPVGDLQLSTQWEDAAPQDMKAFLETLILKQALGAPASTLLQEAGYGEKEVVAMLEEKRQQAASLEDVLNGAMARGELPN